MNVECQVRTPGLPVFKFHVWPNRGITPDLPPTAGRFSLHATQLTDWLIHYSAFFGSTGHVALDRNPGPGYNTLLLRMVPGDLLSACPHRQFHTLPGLLDSLAALSNSYPNPCVPMQGGSLYHFYDGLWYDPAGTRTHDLPCERRTRWPLSHPTRYSMLPRRFYNESGKMKETR